MCLEQLAYAVFFSACYSHCRNVEDESVMRSKAFAESWEGSECKSRERAGCTCKGKKKRAPVVSQTFFVWNVSGSFWHMGIWPPCHRWHVGTGHAVAVLIAVDMSQNDGHTDSFSSVASGVVFPACFSRSKLSRGIRVARGYSVSYRTVSFCCLASIGCPRPFRRAKLDQS